MEHFYFGTLAHPVEHNRFQFGINPLGFKAHVSTQPEHTYSTY